MEIFRALASVWACTCIAQCRTPVLAAARTSSAARTLRWQALSALVPVATVGSLVEVALGSDDGDSVLVGCAVDWVAATLGARVGALAVVVGSPPSLNTAKAPPASRTAI